MPRLLTPKEAQKLENILFRTKKYRIQKKLIKRLADGTEPGFARFLELEGIRIYMDENGQIIIPSFSVLAEYNFK